MRIARTLAAHVMRETIVYCALAFAAMTLILLTQNLLRRLDDLFLVGMTSADFRIVLESLFPVVLAYSVPLAFLVGILLTIRRFGADGELGGMRAAGMSPSQFLIPHLILGLLVSGFLGWVLNIAEHEARRDLVQLFKSVAARGAILEPGKFRRIGTRLVFVEDRQRDGTLAGIMIYDRGKTGPAYRVFADRGRYSFDRERAEIVLELFEGDLHLAPREDAPERYERVRFDAFAYRMDVGHILGGEFGPVRPKQMNINELHSVLARAEEGDPLRELDQRDPREYALEIHRRRTAPLAPLVFAGIGVPLALASEQRSRNLGLLLALIAAFAYYALGALLEEMALRDLVQPALARWSPNLIFGAAALFLIASEQRRIPR
ncbi:MAG: LptF/LptG family permease [Myxococcota bacterium]